MAKGKGVVIGVYRTERRNMLTLPHHNAGTVLFSCNLICKWGPTVRHKYFNWVTTIILHLFAMLAKFSQPLSCLTSRDQIHAVTQTK